MENGRPIEIVTVNSDHLFSLNESSLSQMLLQDNIKDRSVVIISVAGVFRKGKSFLLNFFLRYLYAKYRKNDTTNWLGKDDEPLKGFNWSVGSQKITTGILMWSDIFTLDYKNGDKIAIILLDTQGNFDPGSTVRDWSLIFALSTLLSSVQCFNLKDTIQEDDLMNLNLFTEFGRLAFEDTGNTPFQRLQFIVRDWSFPYEHEYGSNGGQTFLEGILQLKPNMKPESKMIRQQIGNFFNEIECFLMPHPGSVVTTNSRFDGSIKHIDHEFKTYLNQLVPMLLAPENLLPKKINGQHVKAYDLAQMFPIYFNALQTENDFNPISIYMGFAEFQNMKAVNEAELFYRQLMFDVSIGKSMNEHKLRTKHLLSKEQAIQKFRSIPKAGTTDFIKDFLGQLDATLDRLYHSYQKVNKFKQEAEKENRKENFIRVFRGIGSGVMIVGTVALAIFKAMN